jgi:hypothetical protein
MMPSIIETLTGVAPERQEEVRFSDMREDGSFVYRYAVDENYNTTYTLVGNFIESILYGRGSVIEVLARRCEKIVFRWFRWRDEWKDSGFIDLPVPCLFVVKDE